MAEETELETIPEVKTVNVNIETGVIQPDQLDIPENLLSGNDVEVMKPVKKSATPPPPDNFIPAAEKPEKVTFCELHQIEMTRHEKDGKSWFSHKTDTNAWCSGKPALANRGVPA